VRLRPRRNVYEELRRLATQKMARESAGHTLQPTALVHEAWLRRPVAPPSHATGRNAPFFRAPSVPFSRYRPANPNIEAAPLRMPTTPSIHPGRHAGVRQISGNRPLQPSSADW